MARCGYCGYGGPEYSAPYVEQYHHNYEHPGRQVIVVDEETFQEHFADYTDEHERRHTG